MKTPVEIKYKKLLMIQVVLDGVSRSALIKAFPPTHANVYAHHVTVAFKPSIEQAQELSPQCGQEISFSTIAEAADENGQAVLISGVDSNNEFPHITISTAEGVKPSYSNELFKNSLSHELTQQNIQLKGILTFVTKSQKQYTEPVEIVD